MEKYRICKIFLLLLLSHNAVYRGKSEMQASAFQKKIAQLQLF